jgi:hypothetical protein
MRFSARRPRIGGEIGGLDWEACWLQQWGTVAPRVAAHELSRAEDGMQYNNGALAGGKVYVIMLSTEYIFL